MDESRQRSASRCRLRTRALSAGLLVGACGDGGGGGSGGATDSGAGTSASGGSASAGTSTGAGSQGSGASGPSTGTTTAASTSTTSTGGSSSSSGGGPKFDLGAPDLPSGACGCSVDLHEVLGCAGQTLQTCTGSEACDPMTLSCQDACQAAANNQQSVGCEYYAVFMDQHTKTDQNACFAVIVANTWDTPAILELEYDGASIPVDAHAGLPVGSGPSLTYDPYDPMVGVPAGGVAVLFLSGPIGMPSQAFAPCPMTAAVPTGVMFDGTGKGEAFRITSDVPVVAYEINPYGGGSAATTGSSLLLPTSAWGTNYVVANAYNTSPGDPQLNIIAREDGTQVTLFPVANVAGGGGIWPTLAGVPTTINLSAGQHAQIIQDAELTGSIIGSNKPVGLLGGHTCFYVPTGEGYCDHGEQMIPPVSALGHEYVGVMHRPRIAEGMIWRMVGAVDGTQLTWSSNVGGPATLDRGEIAEFTTGTPFHVVSQDEDHPYMLFMYMPGSQWNQLPDKGGYGDPDFVMATPTGQYMRRYVFFADPTYPETSLVVVRAKSGGAFADVNLDCSGALTGWQALGEYEWTRVDLSTGEFQGVGGCSTGRREMVSTAPFGLWVWGWGTPTTTAFTKNVSYGYPAGLDLKPINTVYIPPQG